MGTGKAEMSTTGYFDYNATTPLCREAIEAFEGSVAYFGNPSSRYTLSREVQWRLSAARQQVAQLIGANPDEIIFTSGGTEANNWALKGTLLRALSEYALTQDTEPGHIVISEIEHASVLEVVRYLQRAFAFEATFVKPNWEGLIEPKILKRCLRPHTRLVSVMLVNNEVGSIQPIREIAEIVRPRGIHFHVDGVQGVGKLPVDVYDLQVDTLSFSAHKFYGPKGVGGLYVRDGVVLEPLIHGGGQESGQRGGTEAVAAIAAMAAAAEVAYRSLPEFVNRTNTLRYMLRTLLNERVPGIQFNGPRDPEWQASNTLSVSIPDIRAEALAALLDHKHGIQVSLGSACSNNKSVSLSHVLTAIGLDEPTIKGTLRISLGQYTKEDDLSRFVTAVAECVAELRRIARTVPNELAVA